MRISVRDLSKQFKDADRELTIIDRVNYDFPEKGSVAIVGRSGVGKSTFLQILGGLDSSSHGTVSYGDQILSELSIDELAAFRGKHIGFIFQFHHLLPEFSAVENVSMPLIIGGADEAKASSMAKEMLSLVGLSHRFDHRPGQLSGGESQRVAIARALVTHPDVILADEPTGNLDFRTAEEVQDLLLSVNREVGNVLIVVTHNAELAKKMDLILEMVPGGELVTG